MNSNYVQQPQPPVHRQSDNDDEDREVNDLPKPCQEWVDHEPLHALEHIGYESFHHSMSVEEEGEEEEIDENGMMSASGSSENENVLATASHQS